MPESVQTDIEGERPALPPTNRQECIRQICAELDLLEAEKQEVVDRINDLKEKRVVGELGMKKTEFNVARRMLAMKGEKRDGLMDTIREVFKAMAVGEQSSFIESLDDAQRDSPHEEYGDDGEE